jgi:hypothetical protein
MRKKPSNATTKAQRKQGDEMRQIAHTMRESAARMNKKNTTRREDVNQAVARIVRQATAP